MRRRAFNKDLYYTMHYVEGVSLSDDPVAVE